MTRICIVGAGAVGGYLGAKLALAGESISVLARGATLQALQTEGLRLTEDGITRTAPVQANNEATALGVQDVVIVAVKAPAMESVAQTIGPLIGPDTCVVVAMNGVPWWFFDRPGPLEGLRLQSVDPHGRIAEAIPTRNVLGCVVHLTCSTSAPGHVRHGFGKRLILGEPAGGSSLRLETIGTLFERAGLQIERSDAIQRDIWFKLWGNMTMNPVSVLTGATCDRMLDDPLVSAFCLAVMEEAKAIGARIGCPIAQSGEERSAVTRQLGAFKTSMLQDAEAGRGPLEIDALVASVREIGQHVGVPTPQIDALLGLVRLHAQTRGLY
ncbi:2-dehydropantoate 2-reductase [Ralstonia insidiosa]|jgi:2-dehydropantoate 2-reductase|uniref:2-dehydropantoate 2-reductase n=1 Tax=Ralstonia TaxID=48736 RepID=UPI000664BD91|nr:2-dehydropantoate 2-reductase [Ralstonia insidiosa]KMW44541.1 2-dehydropantoate 2-reductase [Ralstonia sp. MD27]MBX3773264.1 2-dehydropantoate 2-reductase [Ralstonia pickettii]NOZ14409.1 2-dehydropantoate 2-reductase [Betaproteobacteria bacterium]MBA9858365.1 2-dehydropantoate 2-reductase [Ralstonia insidiosa]MBA9872382.1 2-dehydropantoate 2-reductase [Ralstonia insidiosa]